MPAGAGAGVVADFSMEIRVSKNRVRLMEGKEEWQVISARERSACLGDSPRGVKKTQPLTANVYLIPRKTM